MIEVDNPYISSVYCTSLKAERELSIAEKAFEEGGKAQFLADLEWLEDKQLCEFDSDIKCGKGVMFVVTKDEWENFKEV